MNREMNFNSAKDMVWWLMDNEGKELLDTYGRKWMYNRYSFFFQDLGEKEFEEKVSCLHLFGSGIYTII